MLSIALKITIPEDCYVNVFGTNSEVQATGKYKELKISLATGNCFLVNVTDSVRVKTQKGTISLVAESGKIEASSVYGLVKISKIPESNFNYKLESVEGNIYVSKTE